MADKLRVTLRKSPISYTARARGTVRALGLRRIGQSVEVADTPVMRGMARAVSFLVTLEELSGSEGSKPARRRRTAEGRKAEEGSSQT